MGILDRILVGMAAATAGHGGSTGMAVAMATVAPAVTTGAQSGAFGQRHHCPQCKAINPERRSLLRPVQDIAGASVVHEVQ